MKIIPKLFLIASLFAVISCQKKEVPVTRSQTLNTGFEMMDHGNFDGAIKYFEKLAKTDSHPHVLQAWASAYAGRAGISFSKIVAFVSVPVPDESITAPSALLKFDRQAGEYLLMLQRFENHWKKVPKAVSTQVDDLQSALDILSKASTPGTRIYSASLRIVLLKSVIEDGVLQWEQLNQNRLCSEQVKPYVNWAGQVLEGVRLIVHDLEYAFPKNKESYHALQQQVVTAQQQVKVMSWPQVSQCL